MTEIERLTGRRIHVDKGRWGHNHPHKSRVWVSRQIRCVTVATRCEMKRRAAVELVIGHLKAEHRVDRNHLKGPQGDCVNAIPATAATISA